MQSSIRSGPKLGTHCPSQHTSTRPWKNATIFLPGTCHFQLPPDVIKNNDSPSPYYHSITGELLYFVDWKLVCPYINLCCPNCLQAGVKVDDC